MLFNSYEFIFAFLPVTLLVLLPAGRALAQPGARSGWSLASLFFYAWWRPINVLIIAPSIARQLRAWRVRCCGSQRRRDARPRRAARF